MMIYWSLLIAVTIVVLLLIKNTKQSLHKQASNKISEQLQQLKETKSYEEKDSIGLNRFCFAGSGTWIGHKCVCKYPTILTNNNYNGNCDKIVLKNCKALFNIHNGKKLDLETQDPYTEGFCDCDKYYTYDKTLHKCVLTKLGTLSVTNRDTLETTSTLSCDDGYSYSLIYKTCVKDFCTWDILNPQIKINQKTINTNICDCDTINGVIGIKISKDIIGCTKSFLSQSPQTSQFVHYFVINSAGNINHLYPQYLTGDRLKQYLRESLTGIVDDGTTLLSISQYSFTDWFSKYIPKNVKMFTKFGLNNYRVFECDIFFQYILLESDLKRKKTFHSFTPVDEKQIYDNSNFQVPGKNEFMGERRYNYNKLLYSPFLISNENMKLNLYGNNQTFMCYFYTKQNMLVVDTKIN